jgi:hypothetical protein
VRAFGCLAAPFPLDRARTDGPGLGFGLANYDPNPNNGLVDRGFNVLAVIDRDSAQSIRKSNTKRSPFLMTKAGFSPTRRGYGIPVAGLRQDETGLGQPGVVARLEMVDRTRRTYVIRGVGV